MIQTQQTLHEKYAQLSAERQELFWFRFTSSLLRIPSPTVMFCRRNSFIHVQSVENCGTRKKRKENMRKAIDVETFIHVQSGEKCGTRKKRKENMRINSLTFINVQSGGNFGPYRSEL